MSLRNYGPLIDWDCHEFPTYPGFYFENSRQLFENPQGDGLDAALSRGCQYCLLSDQQVGDIFMRFHPSSPPEVSILRFMNLYTESRSREEVVYCCRNRLKILISRGLEFSQFQTMMGYPFQRGFKRGSIQCYSTVNYVIQTGAWKHLFEMLVQIGWNQRNIQELYDEEIFLGITALMEGLQYHTIENAREEFLQQLLKGVVYFQLDTKKLLAELAAEEYNISKAITHAHLQYSEKMNIPGSWAEEEVAVESISEKNLIMPWCLGFYSWSVKASLYNTCIHYGQYHTKCHVPRKEWRLWYDDKQLVEMVDDMKSDEDMENGEDSD
ncbi:hypothetical protein EAE96_010965 [Botrytis aclada]|nr:hypothetical protein EAE96_010965 [Botrytis aclada]